jgi:sucrose-6-phosphate hydrolase SacC (GH32 family)
MQIRVVCLCLILIRLPLSAGAQTGSEDLVLADFEGQSWGEWTATGTAFGTGPAHGTLPGQMPVEGFLGQGLVNSFNGGDASTGTLTSPPFQIQRKYISFLIGGGGWSNKTCLNLLLDEKVVRTATGPNTAPGGSETLAPGFWRVDELKGKTARLQIVDDATGGWGHINADHILQTDHKPPENLKNASRNFALQKRYLLIPVKNGAHKRQVSLSFNGKTKVKNEIELANAEPDWWAFIDVSAWRGKSATLQVDELPEDSRALEQIEQNDNLKNAGELYQESLRQQFHFSSRRGWNNDPNGLVFFKGEYHLFYQHNPYGWSWGNMHWGHAVSRDLMHWEELPDALEPDDLGPMFSGSAVVDWANTSGLGTPNQPAQVLVYTAAGNQAVQCLAYSTDGRRFNKFSANPVIRQMTSGNRDPKVMWHEPTKKWIMCLYVERNNVHTIQFLSSPNLRDWTPLSRVDGFFECPDFFQLPVDGDTSNKKWVLTAANSDYMLGSFDGTTFRPESKILKGQLGRGFYAAQTYSDLPPTDGRRIQIGWFQTETRGMPFNQSMTIPLELKLLSTSDGPRLTWQPAREVASLRSKTNKLNPGTLTAGSPDPFAKLKAELVELRCEFEPEKSADVTFDVHGATITYKSANQELVVNGHRAAAPLRNGKQRLIVFCDRASLEIFASDGLAYVPFPFIPKSQDHSLSLRTTGGGVHFTSLEIHELHSAWSAR